MARSINGSGFKLYFPDAEEELTLTTPHVASSLNHTSATEPSTNTNQLAVGIDNTSPSKKEPPDGGAAALKSPSWQPDAATTNQDASDDTVAEGDKLGLMKHRTSLSIPPVKAVWLTQPDQEPNIRSYQDSRRRSTQLAEDQHRSSVLKS